MIVKIFVEFTGLNVIWVGDDCECDRSHSDVLAVHETGCFFDAQVVESIEEKENGTVTVDPLTLAATSMDHISQLSGPLKWIRF